MLAHSFLPPSLPLSSDPDHLPPPPLVAGVLPYPRRCHHGRPLPPRGHHIRRAPCVSSTNDWVSPLPLLPLPRPLLLLRLKSPTPPSLSPSIYPSSSSVRLTNELKPAPTDFVRLAYGYLPLAWAANTASWGEFFLREVVWERGRERGRAMPSACVLYSSSLLLF